MNPVDKHLAEQAEKHLSTSILFNPRNLTEELQFARLHYMAGAQAAKEIYLLQGEAKAYRLSGMEGAAEEAEAQLEKLLSEKGEG